jgi:hypothetical protein
VEGAVSEAPYRNDVIKDELGRGPARTPKLAKILVYCADSTHADCRVEVDKFAWVPSGCGIHGHQTDSWSVWRPTGAHLPELFGWLGVEQDQQYGLDDDPEGGATFLEGDVPATEANVGCSCDALTHRHRLTRVRYKLECLCGFSVPVRDGERFQAVLSTLHDHGIRSISLQALAARLA